jgi:hypothetical protein
LEVTIQNYFFEKNLISVQSVLKLIDQAINNKNSYSLSRYGIGEITYLLKNSILTQHFQRYRLYAGIQVSDDEIRRELIQALKTTDLHGLIPSWRSGFWAKMTENVLNELQFSPVETCSAWIMHDALKQGLFWPWIRDKLVILVGRRASQAVPIFRENGVQVMESVNLDGYQDLAKAHEALMEKPQWDIAIVSAGIPATILVPKIAKSAGKTAIDFGHALDMIIDGENYNHLHLVQQYNDRYLKEYNQDQK